MKLKHKLKAEERIAGELLGSKINDKNLIKEVEESFMDYAMSVITSRALPDIKDGLKPVHRRILYSASLEDMMNNKKFKKSAFLVGAVMGSFHPHGDKSIYDALVRMSQDFSMRYPLIEGQGNFGSIDGDSPAAMRYTEVKLSKFGECFLEGIKEECVPFVDNYDASKKEPTIMPTSIPNILVNGGTGIAVGMATNIPPHNLGEICDALLLCIDHEHPTTEQLLEVVHGPDFPVGGTVYNSKGIVDYLTTGKGKILIRSKVDIVIEDKSNLLIVREIPYLVKKTKLIQQIVQLVKPPKGHIHREILMANITNIQDESNLKGIRLIIELRKGIDPEVILNNLYKYSNLLQKPFTCNLTVLDSFDDEAANQPVATTDSEAKVKTSKPITASVLTILQLFIKHQIDMLVKRTAFKLVKIKDHIHILEGRLIVADHLMEVVKTISDEEEPEKILLNRFKFSDIQLKDVLSLPLRSLKRVEKSRLQNDLQKSTITKEEYDRILGSIDVQRQKIRESVIELKGKFGDERRTSINLFDNGKITEDDMIPNLSVILSISRKGYVSQTLLSDFKIGKRRNSGSDGSYVYKDDGAWMMHNCRLRDDVLFFTCFGRVFREKSYKISMDFKKKSRGKNIINIFPNLRKGETVVEVFTLSKEEYEQNLCFLFATERGFIKKTHISQFKSVRNNGKIACKLREGDKLIEVDKFKEGAQILLASSKGKVVRFESDEASWRRLNRTAKGSYGMSLDEGDKIICASTSNDPENDCVISVGSNGVGKATTVKSFRLVKRGKKKGVKAQTLTEKTGNLVVCQVADMNDEFLFLTKKNKILRMKGSEVKIQGSATQGNIITKDLGGDKSEIVCFSVIKFADVDIKTNEEEREYDSSITYTDTSDESI